MARFSQQNFYKVNPDGTVSASFPGGARIPAILQPQIFNNPAVNPGVSIQWERQGDGALAAMAVSWADPAPSVDSGLALLATDPDDPVNSPTDGDFAELVLEVKNAPPPVGMVHPQIATLIRSGGTLVDRLIADGAGRSSFVQLRPTFPPQRIETYFLSSTLTWGVASTHSNVQGYSMPWAPTGAVAGAEVAGDIIAISTWPPMGANPLFFRGETVNHAVIGPGNALIWILAWRIF